MGAAGALGNDTKFGNRAGHRLLQLRLGTSWRQTLGLGSGSAFFSPQLHPKKRTWEISQCQQKSDVSTPQLEGTGVVNFSFPSFPSSEFINWLPHGTIHDATDDINLVFQDFRQLLAEKWPGWPWPKISQSGESVTTKNDVFQLGPFNSLQEEYSSIMFDHSSIFHYHQPSLQRFPLQLWDGSRRLAPRLV